MLSLWSSTCCTTTTDGGAQKDIYTYLYSNGDSGGWGWAYDENWKDIQIPMKALYDAHTADIKCP